MSQSLNDNENNASLLSEQQKSGAMNNNLAEKGIEKSSLVEVKEVSEKNVAEETTHKKMERKERKRNERPKKFWQKSQNGVTFEQKEVIDYLEGQGFYKYYLDKENFIIVKLTDGKFKKVEGVDVKDFLIDKLKNEYKEKEVCTAFYEVADKLISKTKLEILPKLECNPLQDTKNEAYFFFRNTIAIVSRDNIEYLPYNNEEQDGCIMESAIINKSFSFTEDESVFEKFIFHAMNKDGKRKKSLMSAFGYLINRNFDPTNTRVVIFTDEQMYGDDEANGGTGKGICAKALSHIRKVTEEDGKNFKVGKNFAFQKVDFDTEILFIDDANKSFNLEDFYSIITNGLSVEKKFKAPFTIPLEQSPKILITSNYVIGGQQGYTDQRRRFEIEFSSYYGESCKPCDEFGHHFFTEWNQEEWDRFYSFMIKCFQLYLKEGLVDYERINITEKKLVYLTSPDFVEFLEGIITGGIEEHEKKNLFNQYVESTSDNIKPRTFNHWVKTYCKLRSIDLKERDSNGKGYYQFKKK